MQTNPDKYETATFFSTDLAICICFTLERRFDYCKRSFLKTISKMAGTGWLRRHGVLERKAKTELLGNFNRVAKKLRRPTISPATIRR